MLCLFVIELYRNREGKEYQAREEISTMWSIVYSILTLDLSYKFSLTNTVKSLPLTISIPSLHYEKFSGPQVRDESFLQFEWEVNCC